MSQLYILRNNQQFQSIAFSQMLTVFGSSLLMPVLPVYLKLQGFSDTKIGILMGVAALGALIVRPWCGRSVDVKGSRPVLLFGQALTAIGVAAFYWTVNFLPLLLLRFFQGVAMAFYGTASVTFASSVETPNNTASAIALFTVFTMVGLGAATSSAPFVFNLVGFYNLVSIGLICIIAAAGIMSLRAKTIPPVSSGRQRSFMSVLRTKDVLAPTICLFASNFAYMTTFTFVPLTALSEGVQFTSFFVAFMIAVVFARLSVNQLVNRIGIIKLATVSSLINVLGAGVVAAMVNPLTLAAAGCFIGIGFGLIYPILTVYVVQHISQANRGAALSALSGAGDIGNALGASVLGVVADLFGYRALFASAAVLVILCTWYFYTALANTSETDLEDYEKKYS